MNDPGNQRQKWLVCALLALAVLVVFWPALRCGFVSYDDPGYVTSNPDIQRGLNGPSLRWALTTGCCANWHPVTWISHILDYQLYGPEPAGHHLTSLLLHLASAVLFFLLLNRMTGALWPSAFVAAMFALHPLRVQSVVWIAERKDVLSTFFWMLSVGAYVRYGENLKSHISNFKFWYALSLVFFALGLMSKAMVVTLPFVLLLLDYWPLGRLAFGPAFCWRLIVEKIPFFLLAAGGSVATFLAQQHDGVVKTLTKYPFSARLANVPVACAGYIGKNFWPSGLAVFYPHRNVGTLEAGGAVCLLVVVSLLAARRWRAQPWLAVGWCWFLGMLVPTLGLVQVGDQSMADRYTYLPSAGLWIMLAWSARDWAGRLPLRRATAALGGAMAIVLCMVLTPPQISCWKNSLTLFQRAAAVTGPNYLGYYNLGCYAVDQGNYPLAIFYFEKTLRAKPDSASLPYDAPAYNNMGFAYLRQGQISNAVANFDKALKLQPRYPEAYFNMGCAFLTNGQPDVAADCFQRALALERNPAILGALAAAQASQARRQPDNSGGIHP
jgi:hypothetical protein